MRAQAGARLDVVAEVDERAKDGHGGHLAGELLAHLEGNPLFAPLARACAVAGKSRSVPYRMKICFRTVCFGLHQASTTILHGKMAFFPVIDASKI